MARRRAPAPVRTRRAVSHGYSVHAPQSTAVLGLARRLRRGGRDHVWRSAGISMDMKTTRATAALVFLASVPLSASGHGPIFGGATPTLGKGGWQFDTAWMG